MNYNYVIFATTFDWYKKMYSEILDREDVRFYQDISEFYSPLEQKLYRFYMSKKVNRILALPNKEKWFERVAEQFQFQKDYPICFIWYSHFVSEIKRGMLDALKRIFPDSRHVMYYTDAKNVNEEELSFLSGKMDAIGVFDRGIAQKYHLKFWPNVYPSDNGQQLKEEYDICFIGNDKGRLALLEKLADKCEKHAINAAFYVKSSDTRKRCKNIRYIDEYLPYELVTDIVKRSKTLLELRMEKYDTWSVRAQEAIVFGKKLLTDNPHVDTLPGRMPLEQVMLFEHPDGIDWDMVKTPNSGEASYGGEFSASAFLEKIKEELA